MCTSRMSSRFHLSKHFRPWSFDESDSETKFSLTVMFAKENSLSLRLWMALDFLGLQLLNLSRWALRLHITLADAALWDGASRVPPQICWVMISDKSGSDVYFFFKAPLAILRCSRAAISLLQVRRFLKPLCVSRRDLLTAKKESGRGPKITKTIALKKSPFPNNQ